MSEEMKVVSVSVDAIEQNENSRVIYKSGDLSELMTSMKRNGLLQPVGVRVIPGTKKYDMVFGNRRLLAAKKLGWADIPATIIDAKTDVERDIINLLENLKRQNTTPAEDGRAFDVLMSYGLSQKEIAARLDISVHRVEMALDVYKEFPAEFKALVVNRAPGAKKVAGKIPATSAYVINTIRKKQRLNRATTRALLEFAKEPETTVQHICQVAPLMKEGLSLREAIETAESLTRVSVEFFLDSKVAAKLEKKSGKTMRTLAFEALTKTFPVHQTKRVRFRDKTSQHEAPGSRAET